MGAGLRPDRPEVLGLHGLPVRLAHIESQPEDGCGQAMTRRQQHRT